MPGCFVRVLFGDDKVPNFSHVLDEVAWCLSRPFQPQPTLWFAYGRGNAKYLEQCGVTPVLMDDESFCRFGSAGPEQAHHYSTIRYNSSCWRMKYPCVRHALERYPACVYLDLDTVLVEPLPDDFWQVLGLGAEFQATLQQNHRKRAGWRMKQTWPGKQSTDEDARKTPAGAFLYFRGLPIIDKLLAMYAERPFEWDMHVLARLTETFTGGQWMGCDAYREVGIEPPFHSLGKFQGRQLFKPERPVFVTHWRKPRLRRFGPSETPYILAKEFPELK